jgi:HEAT repeat protein
VIVATLPTAIASAAPEQTGVARYKGKSAQQWSEELTHRSMEAFHALTAPEKDAVPVLGELLGSDIPLVRSIAAEGLAEVAPDAVSVVGPLAQALKDKNLNVRFYAGRALTGMGPAASAAVPALIGALDTHPSREPDLEGPPHYYKDARSVAAEALAAIGPAAKAALPRLREAAASDDASEVRAAAAEALKKIEAK